MAVEGIRVTVVHHADEYPQDWVHCLRAQCDGAEPNLVAAEGATLAEILSNKPHRVFILAPLEPEIIHDLIDNGPILVDAEGLPALMKFYGTDCPVIQEEKRMDENYLMHDSSGLWAGFGEPIEVQGYPHHSPQMDTLPARLMFSAWNDERVCLALRDRTLPVVAWNFHPMDLPEGVGKELVTSFLEGHTLRGLPEGPPEV